MFEGSPKKSAQEPGGATSTAQATATLDGGADADHPADRRQVASARSASPRRRGTSAHKIEGASEPRNSKRATRKGQRASTLDDLNDPVDDTDAMRMLAAIIARRWMRDYKSKLKSPPDAA
jgi:hypothetical protein